jgi:hypothetical protein
MDNDIEPVVGNWYKRIDDDHPFRVVEIDEDEDTVTVQHFDGDLEAIDSSAWFDMDIEIAEEPEDWTGPVDDVDDEDLTYTETSAEESGWRKAPARRRTKEQWEDDTPEDERGDWDEGETDEDVYDPNE